ncbi:MULTISPECIES: 30S ribosomal protein S3 [Pseudothermotoga]|uniref:Small ribosomal subunit protein uS3 n=1 Tax=Pseudothermotoga lettingae (strain ATCC BAA-301 / DSM 14385 / NBRC 107922 / TMO) TaxID=416591 RepID=RS3_PSELT|nr:MULTISPECIES: 30S ribosomal protein S3 [Pseudothermotoga]A8F4R7.1 RecName: Full=Small ribosomal subunit protein uS3; AltName: Full=30S ribosomal protein S3 [Pseudothermotoga lettingae TMO]ABV33151.1 ribosomal protein S3 [Pseudothermotoga lettingae TMO]KUK21642.1 MAG: 30S ribosomal protein S3 [Pseudothermotoga lettingae]MDI3494418.1 small subunit ribosomal protein [Pseudothermotoga sp.]MDK2884157.1 small subunit ribosomal protein [Pseudothermotoga sp.]GLI47847.1 30S ribosomal protein S3 [Ps
MGQKVHPRGFRLGVSADWQTRWFNEKNYATWLKEDEEIRKVVKNAYSQAGISEVFIERPDNESVTITIKTARPGVIIGKKGAEIGKLREDLEKELNRRVIVNVEEIKTPETDAQLVAENIAGRIEKRASYKRAMKRALSDALRKGATGVKVMVSGRLAGAEIARREWYLRGRLPLQTVRAVVDYGTATAKTKYGTIGIKVWIYKGDAEV